MITWKPWTKFMKPRGEWAYHADVALEEGEELQLLFPDGEIKRIRCPEHAVLKLHMEICAEPFEKE